MAVEWQRFAYADQWMRMDTDGCGWAPIVQDAQPVLPTCADTRILGPPYCVWPPGFGLNCCMGAVGLVGADIGPDEL